MADTEILLDYGLATAEGVGEPGGLTDAELDAATDAMDDAEYLHSLLGVRDDASAFGAEVGGDSLFYDAPPAPPAVGSFMFSDAGDQFMAECPPLEYFATTDN